MRPSLPRPPVQCWAHSVSSCFTFERLLYIFMHTCTWEEAGLARTKATLFPAERTRYCSEVIEASLHPKPWVIWYPLLLWWLLSWSDLYLEEGHSFDWAQGPIDPCLPAASTNCTWKATHAFLKLSTLAYKCSHGHPHTHMHTHTQRQTSYVTIRSTDILNWNIRKRPYHMC